MNGTGPNLPTAAQFNPASGVAAEALWKQVRVREVFRHVYGSSTP